MKTVLVTGASGFLGRHVVEALARSGIRPRCMVRRTSRTDSLRDFSPELVTGDLTSRATLESALDGVDGVAHCAGLTRAASLAEYMRVNADGSENLYRACLVINPSIERIVHIGSLAAWGPAAPDTPVHSDQAPRPVSNYGRSKLAGQRIAGAHMDRLPIVILAPPAVYGPFDRAFLGLFACVKRGIAPVIGRGERWLSLIYAKDLAGAVLACLQDERAAGRTYLVDDGRPHAWSEVTTAIGTSMRTRPVRVRIPLPAARFAGACLGWAARLTGRTSIFCPDRLKDFQHPSWTCASPRIREDLGFTPLYPIEQGIEETCRWYREQHWL